MTDGDDGREAGGDEVNEDAGMRREDGGSDAARREMKETEGKME